MARRRARNRVAEIVLTSFLIALFLLIGVAGLLWVAQSGALSGPTPTPTATPAPSFTPTFDFRATRIAEDMLTQVAYSVALATRAAEMMAALTPTPLPLETPAVTPKFEEEPTAEELPPTSEPFDSLATPTEVSVLIPIVAGENLLDATATAQAAEQIPGDVQPTETPTEVETPTPEIPTPTPELPTSTPVPVTPTPTSAILVPFLRAVVGTSEAKVYIGPGSIYTPTNPPSLAPGTAINLTGRDAAGEWVSMCCLPGTNTAGWVRSARINASENPTPVGAPANTDGNDIRLLVVLPAPPINATPIPTLTPIAPDDFPLTRREASNQGRVASLPRLPYRFGWPNPAQAAGPFLSGVVVSWGQVVAASADNHVYSHDRLNGSQRWRYNVREPTNLTPIMADGYIFVLTPSGRMFSLDQNGQLRWEQFHGFQSRQGAVSGLGNLYITGTADGSDRLFVLSQSNGAVVRTWAVPEGNTLQAPALGGQMIFMAGQRIWALDIFKEEVVWQSDPFGFISAPVYSAPGVRAAAELYAADGTGRVLAFNANTGRKLWESPGGQPLASLAVNSDQVIGVGADGVTVRAFSRESGLPIWVQNVPTGAVVGGPIVDDERVLVASAAGGLSIIEKFSGAVQVANVQTSAIAGSIAVSGPYIFTASSTGQIFSVEQSP